MVAVDLGRSIDVARINLPPDVLTVQADAERLPFEPGTFRPRNVDRCVAPLARPRARASPSSPAWRSPAGTCTSISTGSRSSGHIAPCCELVTAARVVTVRMPHRLLHALCYPLAAFLKVTAVMPYRALRARPRGRALASWFPLKTYADYPFGVLVNDQFDRFSAPLERRFTRRQVMTILTEAGLEDVAVLPNHGWVGDGRVPTDMSRPDEDEADPIQRPSGDGGE